MAAARSIGTSMAARRLAVLCLVAGCASKPAGVRPIDEEARFRRESRTALDSDDLSERTRSFLRRNLLDAKDLPALHARLLEQRERDLAFHLAEIAFADGKASRDPGDAAKCFLSSAAYAYAFLFDETLGPPPSPFDPAFRWSCDIYNRALGRVIAREGHDRHAKAPRLPALLWDVDFERGRAETAWDPEEYERVVVASDLEVTGLADYARTRGFGVAVVGVRAAPAAESDDAADRFLPPVKLTQASTVVARFGALPPRGGAQHALLDILDPRRTPETRIGNLDVLLDADFTTPMAYMLEEAPVYRGFDAMLEGEHYEKCAGLFMLQPYEPGRIPVVFVHGLMSAPQTWLPLMNDVLADPVLRSRCQFWFFRYPTGFPVLYSAALLRGALSSVARTYDPEGRDPAFRHMVLCSHSMGGLLSRIQVQSGRGRLWSLLSETPIDRLDIPEDDKEMLRRGFEFDRLPFVTRVVFMATPHRGSELATSLIGDLGASMISEPAKLLVVKDAVRPTLRDEYRKLGSDAVEHAMTGIGNLDPNHPVQREVAKWAYPPDVAIHSVIGNERAAEPGGTDGVVAYWSSHLEGVASEKVVKSGHSVHRARAGIEEVRRILRLHIAEFDAGAKPGP